MKNRMSTTFSPILNIMAGPGHYLRTLTGGMRCFFIAVLGMLPLVCKAEKPAPLTRIAEVRSLTREQAAEQKPVVVRCVVNYAGRGRSDFIVEDGSDGCFVTVESDVEPSSAGGFDKIGALESGMLVEVRGVTLPGGFAPTILMESVKILGAVTPSKALSVSLPDLRTGCYDCRRVELGGVVQRIYREPGEALKARLEIATRDGGFAVTIDDSQGLDTRNLVDAEVRVSGICCMFFSVRGEANGVYLRVPGAGDVTIVKPATADPFAVPEAASLALLPFRREPPSLNRQRFSGVVSLARPSRFLYVQTKQRGFRVNTSSSEEFAPGDVVDVSGFIERANGFGIMTEAQVRKTGRASLPMPMNVSPSQILNVADVSPSTLRGEDYEGTLVVMRGRLAKFENAPDLESHRFYVDCQGMLIAATLPDSLPAAELARFPLGSEVELTGICSAQLNVLWPENFVARTIGFSLLLQGSESIRVLRGPPWWTSARLRMVVISLVSVVAAALAWVFLLRRRVRQQSQRIEVALSTHRDTELEYQAALRERHHLAADLHDGLQQIIVGASFRLEAAEAYEFDASQKLREQLDAARSAVQRALHALRDSLHSLRGIQEGPREFAALVEHMVAGMDHWPENAVRVVVLGDAFSLSRQVMGSLLMLVQEASSNALRHGKARSITIKVHYMTTGLDLSIKDDGQGFDPQNAPGIAEGHFGLDSLRNRMKWLNGSLMIRSNVGTGTCVTAHLPRHSAASKSVDFHPSAL